MKPVHRVLVAFCSLLILPAVVTAQPGRQLSEEEQLLLAMHTIDSATLYGWVDTLASERFAGRLTGTDAYNECAEWVIDHFREWGVAPGGENGTWLQAFPIPYTLVFRDCDLYLHVPFGADTIEKHYPYEEDWYPGSTSASGEITAEVVYVGYGITAPELDYDDYAGVDVRGKIVAYEPEAPVSPRDGEEVFMKWRPYSFHQYKLENAVAHGAAGLIYDYHIVNPNNAYAEGFIYSMVSRRVLADLFAGTGRDHAATIASIREDLTPQSFATGKTFTIRNSTEHHPEGIGYNVIGLIEGSDPDLRDEVIIIGGHLDHLGYCYELIPGANDNASAVAVAMGIARAMARSAVRPKRSVLFLLFGAEEQGVVGSEYYLDHPIFPLEQTVGLLNMDGVGCGDRINAGAGANYPAFQAFLDRANERWIHRQMRAGTNANLGRPRLDAARFMWANVPSISFSVSGSRSYYHHTLDAIETITPEIMEDLAQLLFMAVMDMADEETLDFRGDQENTRPGRDDPI